MANVGCTLGLNYWVGREGLGIYPLVYRVFDVLGYGGGLTREEPCFAQRWTAAFLAYQTDMRWATHPLRCSAVEGVGKVSVLECVCGDGAVC